MELIAPENFELSYTVSRPETVPIFSIGSSSPVEYLFSDKEEHYFVLMTYSHSIVINMICRKSSKYTNHSLWYGSVANIYDAEGKKDLFMFSGTENLAAECNKIENPIIRDTLTNFVLSNLDFFAKM